LRLATRPAVKERAANVLHRFKDILDACFADQSFCWSARSPERYFCCGRRYRFGRGLAIAAIILLFAAATLPLSAVLLVPLEDRFP
jgi:hypothetical protein